MILNFKTHFPAKKPFNKRPTNFERKIMSGDKIHTMREDAGDRWKDGTMAHLSIGARSKNYKCLHHLPVKIQRVKIDWEEIMEGSENVAKRRSTPQMFIDGRKAGIMEQVLLASNDGFDTMDDFYAWFNESKTYKLLHWTDFTYDGDITKLEMKKK